MGFLFPLGVCALAAPSVRKSLPWMSAELTPVISQVSILTSLENLHPHPTTVTYFYYLHRADAVHLSTRLSQLLQCAVSETEFSTSRCLVFVEWGDGDSYTSALELVWEEDQQVAWKQVGRTLQLRSCPIHLGAD